MKLARRIHVHRGATRTWLSGVLIALGGALNLMAFVIVGASDGGPIGVSPPADLHADDHQVARSAQSIPADTATTDPESHHHAHTATATPMPNVAPTYRTGSLTAGYLSRGTSPESWAAQALERMGIEAPQPAGPVAEATPPVAPDMPPAVHVAVAAVGIDTSVVEVVPAKSESHGRTVFTWTVADWAAGHHITSADPGEGGNIILTGHDDVRGEVFRGLHDIQLGDQVQLTSPAGVFTYAVTEIHVREYRNASPEELIAAGRFLAPMPEERVTLVTCWPYGIDTHRIIVVAKPIEPR